MAHIQHSVFLPSLWNSVITVMKSSILWGIGGSCSLGSAGLSGLAGESDRTPEGLGKGILMLNIYLLGPFLSPGLGLYT